MAKRKDTEFRKDIEFRPSKELQSELNEGSSSKRQQDVNLSKGEKGSSSSRGIGKSALEQQRKKK